MVFKGFIQYAVEGKPYTTGTNKIGVNIKPLLHTFILMPGSRGASLCNPQQKRILTNNNKYPVASGVISSQVVLACWTEPLQKRIMKYIIDKKRSSVKIVLDDTYIQQKPFYIVFMTLQKIYLQNPLCF